MLGCGRLFLREQGIGTMKGVLSRARSSPRGGGEIAGKEKEPFYVGPYRSKSASPGRKPRSNSENVPPDNNVHVRSSYCRS